MTDTPVDLQNGSVWDAFAPYGGQHLAAVSICVVVDVVVRPSHCWYCRGNGPQDASLWEQTES